MKRGFCQAPFLENSNNFIVVNVSGCHVIELNLNLLTQVEGLALFQLPDPDLSRSVLKSNGFLIHLAHSSGNNVEHFVLMSCYIDSTEQSGCEQAGNDDGCNDVLHGCYLLCSWRLSLSLCVFIIAFRELFVKSFFTILHTFFL